MNDNGYKVVELRSHGDLNQLLNVTSRVEVWKIPKTGI